MPSWIEILLLATVMTGCGGRMLEVSDGGGGVGGTESGSAGAEAGASEEVGGTCSGSASSPFGSDPQQSPAQPGCYAYVAGEWQPIPCDCDLWLTNRETVPVLVRFSFELQPSDSEPSLVDSPDRPDVEITFEDPDASWYAVWERESDNGTAYSVVNTDDTTTVRLGATQVTLAPVRLAACEERRPRARIVAPWGIERHLDMLATLQGPAETPVSIVNGSCSQPASHPTPI